MANRNWVGPNNSANNPGSGLWGVATNWQGNAVPGTGDAVTFGGNNTASAYTVTISGINPTVQGVTFSSTTALATLAVGAQTLTVTNAGATAINMNLHSALTLAGGTVNLTNATGGITTVAGSTISGAGTVAALGAISGSGAITATGGTLDLNATLTGTTTLAVNGAADTLKLDKISTATSVGFNGSTGTLELNTAATLTLTSALAIGAGTVKLDAAGTTQLTDTNGVTLAGGTISGTGRVAANTGISGHGTLAIPVSLATTVQATGGTLDVTGVIGSTAILQVGNVSGDTLKVDSASSAASLTFQGTAGKLEIGATGTLSVTAAMAIGANTIQLDGPSSHLTGTSNFTITSGTITGLGLMTGTVAASGAAHITASGGTLIMASAVTGTALLLADTASTDTLQFNAAGNTASSVTLNNGTLRLNTATVTLAVTNAMAIGAGTVDLVAAGATLTDTNGLTLANGHISGLGSVAANTNISGFGIVAIPISNAGTITASGGTLDLTGTVSGRTLAITAGSDLKIDGTTTSAAIAINNSAQTLEVGALGNLTITGTESITNGTIQLDGGTLTDAAGVSVGSGAKLLGKGVVVGPISGGGTIEATGGLLNIGGNLTSGMVLQADSAVSSVLELGGTVSTSTSFTYLNTGGVFSGTLQLDAGALVSFGANAVISGMHEATGPGTSPTDVLDLRSVAFSSSYSTDIVGGNTIQLWSNPAHGSLLASFNLAGTVAPGTFVDWQNDGANGTSLFLDDNPCYAAGTRILTATGERMVESLMQGDIVLTLSGGELVAQPVKWIGQRRIDLTAHPHPETVTPIRIQRGAFADNMPHRDLLVSPDHAVFVDGKLICARQLVNGSTIRQDKDRMSVEYFHVELDSHAILLAEGLPAESYLNTGNHGFFINSGEPLVLHPDMTDETDYPTRQAGSCAPFMSDEASVRPVWQRLAERAAALGQPGPKVAMTSNPELLLVAKGRTVRPLYGENGLYIFALPKGATEARVVSRASAPTDTRPWLDDRRCLGVNVERIVLRGAGERREVPVDHPSLVQGWHEVERDGVALRRWTTGNAVLPLPALRGPTMLEIRASNGGMTYLADAEQEQRAA